ncbi:MAG: general stress protein [Defluviitaleaceae bacterium]|nr:general stress protein [Defluviitaleaceae bacterium]MCL2238588.1 general stress protein [Defluviitaleaceae bacterium]
MSQEIIAKAGKVVTRNTVEDGKYTGGISVLSLIDLEGFPTASVLSPSKSDGINWMTFCTNINANGAKRIAKCKRASVCFATVEYCINLVGEVEIITTPEVKAEMWYDGLSHHFTGADDPSYCVFKFTTKRYKILFTETGEEAEGTI